MIKNRFLSIVCKSFRTTLGERFLETESVEYKKEERNKTITNKENQLVVLLTVGENSNISHARV